MYWRYLPSNRARNCNGLVSLWNTDVCKRPPSLRISSGEQVFEDFKTPRYPKVDGITSIALSSLHLSYTKFITSSQRSCLWSLHRRHNCHLPIMARNLLPPNCTRRSCPCRSLLPPPRNCAPHEERRACWSSYQS